MRKKTERGREYQEIAKTQGNCQKYMKIFKIQYQKTDQTQGNNYTQNQQIHVL